MKKTAILSSLLFALPLVSAQNLPAPPIALNGVTDMFNAILNGTSGNSEVVARVLVFLILAIVLYKPASKIVGENGKWGVVLSVIISTMAVRFFTYDMIKGLFLPYQALGVAVSVLIPFLLLEYFFLFQDETMPRQFRTIGYLIMIGTFVGMWWFRWTDIGDLAYYYLGAAVLSLLAMWWDGTLRKWLDMGRIHSREDRAIYLQILEMEERLEEAVKKRGVAIRTGEKGLIDITNQIIKELESGIKKLRKQIK